jgi:hypothetical protein
VRQPILTLLACMALTPFSSVHAQAYLAATYGVGDIHSPCKSGESCNRAGSFHQALLGYTFAHGIGLEAGHLANGKFEAHSAHTDMQVTAHGTTLGVRLDVPLSAVWEMDTRLGFANMSTEGTGTGPTNLTTSNTHHKGYVGLGAGYALTPHVKLTTDVSSAMGYWRAKNAELRGIGMGLRIVL